MGSHQSGSSRANAPHSSSYTGRYGRLCGELPAWYPEGSTSAQDTFFKDVARNRMVERPNELPRNLLAEEIAIQTQHDSNIPAAYTYFGQFIDHDITFDPTPIGSQDRDPNGLNNFRTPRLDLDNIYGRGPEDQPYLYKTNLHFRTKKASKSKVPDLPRFDDEAVIGDKRNDENAIVSQIHLCFLLAHNTLADRAKNILGFDNARAFKEARRCLQRLYHHIVWHDYLHRLTQNDIHNNALKLEGLGAGPLHWATGLQHIYKWKFQPFIPLEFSGAAYRFGHSMVRNGYQTNSQVRGFSNFAALFSRDANRDDPDLRGGRKIHRKNILQWDWFLPMQSSGGPFPQMARKIDTKLSNALSHLDGGSQNTPQNILAFLNLKRGVILGLPAGPDMARLYGIDPVGVLEPGDPESLWFYILKEAEVQGNGQLGRLGSSIICAVFSGLLKGDPNSFFNYNPSWNPEEEPLLISGQDNMDSMQEPDERAWQLSSIIRLAKAHDENIVISGDDAIDEV